MPPPFLLYSERTKTNIDSRYIQGICESTMKFEFDAGKSRNNLKKHGIDFIEGQKLWDDPGLIEIPAKTKDEKRYLVIGRISEKNLVWCHNLPK